jgi:hypothetical protein
LLARSEPSVGGAGDSYDNVLAESIFGLFRAEEIRRRGPRKGVEEAGFATLEWVACYKTRPLREPLVPPDEFERADYRPQTAPEPATSCAPDNRHDDSRKGSVAKTRT